MAVYIVELTREVKHNGFIYVEATDETEAIELAQEYSREVIVDDDLYYVDSTETAVATPCLRDQEKHARDFGGVFLDDSGPPYMKYAHSLRFRDRLQVKK